MRNGLIAIGMGAALALGGCASMGASSTGVEASATAQARAELGRVAEDYVRVILEIGEREPGYVDAYYGPEAWATEAKAAPRTVDQLIHAANAMRARLAGLPTAGLTADERQRVRYLDAHLSAAEARLRMLNGWRPSFAEEAEALFGVRPPIRPLTEFDPILAEVERLVPGEGDLNTRVAAFRARYIVPADRVQAVMDASIAECRRRTARHIPLPAEERFTLEFVTDKPWSGYNWYKGGAVSLIQINTDLPVSIERAVDLGCHEGYPGHHVYNALLEQTFVREKGWVEMSVYPLFSPMSFIAEGSANYGIDLAFPGDQKTVFERDVLYPMAGLDPASAADLERFLSLQRRLAGAEYAIADAYLGGRIDRAEAVRQLMRYSLSTRERAEQRTRFMDTYRSYIINYGLGRDTVQSWVEGQGPDHWATTRRLLASQILPVDLLR